MVRMLCIVNHSVIFNSEIKIFERLGIETYTPMFIPTSDPDLRSISTRNNITSLPKDIVEKLDAHSFWTEEWDYEIRSIISNYFDIVYVAINSYLTPLHQSLMFFNKLIIARAFGREIPYRYEDFLQMKPELNLANLIKNNCKFYFVPVFKQILEIEPSYLIQQNEVIGLSLPDDWFKYKNSWCGENFSKIIFLCPNINDSIYYNNLYLKFKQYFKNFDHSIFGKQYTKVNDPCVLEYLAEDALFKLYQTSKLLVYLSSEPRHLHYTPIECMLVGIPVIYLKGSLLSEIINYNINLNEADFGECKDMEEMVQKVQYLLSDTESSRIHLKEIKKIQLNIASLWSSEFFLKQWVKFLGGQNISLSI